MSAPRAPRPGSIRILYKLAIFDMDARVMPHKGHQVEVTQPHGGPRNGTMGHCYVNCLTCGNITGRVYFLGLVCLGSMYKPNEPVEVLGLAANGKHHVRCADGSERVTATIPEYLLSN
jgi:hypothetical protein